MTLEDKRLRTFGCILGGILTFLGGLSLYTHEPVSFPFFLIYFGLALLELIVAFVWAKALAPFEKAFIRVGEIMGSIITRVVLGLVFFFILTPLGIFFKLTRRKHPFPAIDKTAPSYWEDSENSSPERFKRQF